MPSQQSDSASKTEVGRGGQSHEMSAATVLYVPGQSREQHRSSDKFCVAVLLSGRVVVYATKHVGNEDEERVAGKSVDKAVYEAILDGVMREFRVVFHLHFFEDPCSIGINGADPYAQIIRNIL